MQSFAELLVNVPRQGNFFYLPACRSGVAILQASSFRTFPNRLQEASKELPGL
jgi:hypothetical protein